MEILGRLFVTRSAGLARLQVRCLVSCLHEGVGQSEASTLRASANHVSSFKPALLSRQSHSPHIPCRYMAKKSKSGKSKGSSSFYDDDASDDEEMGFSLESGEGWKDVVIQTNSLRVDAIAKMIFKASRHSAESDFYGNKFRLNGGKIKKKGVWLSVGDKLDLVDGDFVTRAEVMKMDVEKMKSGGKFAVVVRRFGKVEGHEDYKHEY